MLKRYRYLAMDESNHGKFPEVFFMVFSDIVSDIPISSGISLEKIRGDSNTTFRELRKRNYAFLMLSEHDKRMYKSKAGARALFGGIVGTLIFGMPLEDDFELYLDGKVGDDFLEYAEMAAEYVAGKDSSAKVVSATKLDVRMPLANIADQGASFFYRRAERKPTTHLLNSFHYRSLRHDIIEALL